MFRRRTAAPATDPSLRAGRLALLTTSAVHLGFQSVVTSDVYPQLFDGQTHGLAERQADHARRIAPVAIAVYTSSLCAAGWAVYGSIRSPGRQGLTSTAIACATSAVAPALTAGLAVPIHVGVANERSTPPQLKALLASDRVRTGLAALGVAAAAQSISY